MSHAFKRFAVLFTVDIVPVGNVGEAVNVARDIRYFCMYFFRVVAPFGSHFENFHCVASQITIDTTAASHTRVASTVAIRSASAIESESAMIDTAMADDTPRMSSAFMYRRRRCQTKLTAFGVQRLQGKAG